MKGVALVLLCAFVAVQARSTGVQTSSTALAALGENPWQVHLRIAIGTSGFLNTCAGSLIDQRWVLTAAECLDDTRFIWIRYGVVEVISPELVTETSQVRVNSEANIGLIDINRNVQYTANISPVALAATVAIPETATFCGFGEENDGPGEVLSCYEVTLRSADDQTIVAFSEEYQTSRFDIGSPLVSEGVQIGVLVAAGNGENAGTFVNPANAIEWIQENTGIQM